MRGLDYLNTRNILILNNFIPFRPLIFYIRFVLCPIYEADAIERKNIIEELEARGARYFLGDDKTENSVRMAYESALTFLENNELFTFNSDDTIVRSFEEVYLKDRSKKKERIDGQPTLFEE